MTGFEGQALDSRVFVICGKSVSEEDLSNSFSPIGEIEHLKIVREKGVAYVKYDRASSAALAIENLNGAILNNGRGPKLKVLLAEAPNSRASEPKCMPEAEISSDPDNSPPRSRLFIVVPKQADVAQIMEHMKEYEEDLEYCKTDLISSKGVLFCKYRKSSSALKTLESICARGTLSGYKVKAMLAEPKTRRVKANGLQAEALYHQQQAPLDYNLDAMKLLRLGMGLGAHPSPLNLSELGSLGIFPGLAGMGAGLGNCSSALAASVNAQSPEVPVGIQLPASNGLRNLCVDSSAPTNSVAGTALSRQRLFIVVNKGVPDEALARLFRRFPGMEYCDLKKDRATCRSKGYCYVNYSTPEAAAAAVFHLNGIEFPPHSGHKIKVMFAEPLGVRPTDATSPGSSLARGAAAAEMQSSSPASNRALSGSSPSSLATPLSFRDRDNGLDMVAPGQMCNVNNALVNASLQRLSSSSGLVTAENGMLEPQQARARGPAPVAHELMYNVTRV